MAELVFVYGTLRKGHGNHVLLKDSKFIDYGFTKKGPNGGWIFDEKVYNAKKPDGTYVLNDNQRREIIQIFQTDIDQTVPYSFTQEKNVKNLAFNEEYVAYNKKYGARAE